MMCNRVCEKSRYRWIENSNRSPISIDHISSSPRMLCPSPSPPSPYFPITVHYCTVCRFSSRGPHSLTHSFTHSSFSPPELPSAPTLPSSPTLSDSVLCPGTSTHEGTPHLAPRTFPREPSCIWKEVSRKVYVTRSSSELRRSFNRLLRCPVVRSVGRWTSWSVGCAVGR